MDKSHSDKHDDIVKNKDLEQHEVKQVLDFIKQYGKLIGIGVVAATVVVMASKGIAQKKANKLIDAEERLVAAQTPEQLEAVVSEYGATPAGPAALLNLAKTHFNNGEYFLSREQYKRFLKEYGSSDLAPMADYGLASCTEADGEFGKAAELFKSFLDTNKDHFLVSPATLGLARSLKQADRADEARIVLEDFLAANATSQWASQAETALEEL